MKKCLVSLLLCVSAAFPIRAQGGILVTEIMYQPQNAHQDEQWIEFYNTDSFPVNLGGWSISKGCKFTFPSDVVIDSKSYLVVAASTERFKALHPEKIDVVGNWEGSIGTHVQLLDTLGNVVDDVNFASDGDWAERRLGPLDKGHRGWEWYAAHDGLGMSLELISLNLPNEYAHNWSSSETPGGTPGSVNSIAKSNVPPFVVNARHDPIIPRSIDSVTISARLIDENANGISATLLWRLDGKTPFESVAMMDDGSNGDLQAGDGVFSALIPPQPQGSVVEYYIQVSDLEGNGRTYPQVLLPTDSPRTANFLYQVEDESNRGSHPLYRIIMREVERAELYELGSRTPEADSNAEMNATWITYDGTERDGGKLQLRYNAGIRNRGHGTRTSIPHNYHVEIPTDRRWKNSDGINLNSVYTYSQVLGSAIFQKAGVPAADSRFVEVRINGVNLMKDSGNSYGLYAANEQINGRFVKRFWPHDSDGNLYRCSYEGDFSWHGDDFLGSTAYTLHYFKDNHQRENDFSDLIQLCGVLSLIPNYATEADYTQRVRETLDVEEWMRYMAVNVLLRNDETCLATGDGDDFGLYREGKNSRFLLLSYDMDSLMGWGVHEALSEKGIWEMTQLPTMERFMKNPEFAPIYLRYLKELAQTTFSPEQMNPLIDQILGGNIPEATINKMKRFNANQVDYVLSQLSQELTLQHNLVTNNSYLYTTNPIIALHGTGDGIRTVQVLVNGMEANWTAWKCEWAIDNLMLEPGVNKIKIQALGEGKEPVEEKIIDVWYDTQQLQQYGGVLQRDTFLSAKDGPYSIISDLTIPQGVTLQIEAGTTLFLGQGVGIIVSDGGTLKAEGTENKVISFLPPPGSSSSWGKISIQGSIGSPESVIEYARFDGNGSPCIHVNAGTLRLEHSVFENNKKYYLSLDGASFFINDCTFPSAATGSNFELVHGTQGIKKGGRGIIQNCFFGKVTGYSDTIDFTGGIRPNGAILQVLNNVFMESDDDMLDLDGTDAWIEGNIFAHAHKGSKTPDSSSAVSGGDYSGWGTSEITIIGNIFYDCDSAMTAKINNYYTLLNNTIVRSTKEGGVDTESGVINLKDYEPDYGKGCYVEGNIIVDVEQLVRNYNPAESTVVFKNNILPLNWEGPGEGNRIIDPLFNYVPKLEETFFKTYSQAQVLRNWFSLKSASPAIGTGINGWDSGAENKRGISISGEPDTITNQRSATLNVGPYIAPDILSVSDFPEGSGYTHYHWRLDGGQWSEENSSTTPIQLDNLTEGEHSVEVIGKNDAGYYQNDPELWGESQITRSRAWTVSKDYEPEPAVQINEIYVFPHSQSLASEEIDSSYVEIFNTGSTTVDLSAMGLTDDQHISHKYTFPAGTLLEPNSFLVLTGGSSKKAGYECLGFDLQPQCSQLYLYDDSAKGENLLDYVNYGFQLAGYSLGRMGETNWSLCTPTMETENLSVSTAPSHVIRINEWMCDGNFTTYNGFIELYNPSAHPVNLGGTYLSDSGGCPELFSIPEWSFIGAGGHIVFNADGKPENGSDHLSFRLNSDGGTLLLSDTDLTPIDLVHYDTQTTDMAEGRSPDGANKIGFLGEPTPGIPNPKISVTESTTLVTEELPLLSMGDNWKYYQAGSLDGIDWMSQDYDDSQWASGLGLLGVENSSLPSPGLQTLLTLGKRTYYFRTEFTSNRELTNALYTLKTVVDDGVIIYLNGAPIHTNRMSNGAPSYSDYASETVGNASLESFTLENIACQQGRNVLAAEVHQVNSSSTDIVYGMSLTAALTTNIVSLSADILVLNEVQSLGAPEDFIEIYNPSTHTIDLSGIGITDDIIDPYKWSFRADTHLEANSFLVIQSSGTDPLSETNTAIQLSPEGGTLFLFNTTSAGANLIDSIRYGLQVPGYSLGKIPNGSGDWALSSPTPGQTNIQVLTGDTSSLFINEWMADPKTGDDWFEIYNSGELPVELSGLYLTDNLLTPWKSPIAPLSFIGTKENAFALFWANGILSGGHANFSLKKSGESLGIYTPMGVLIDSVVFDKQQTEVSQGRFPDGGDVIVSFSEQPSPGFPNRVSVEPSPITITGCHLTDEAFIIELDKDPSGWKVQVAPSLSGTTWSDVPFEINGKELTILHKNNPLSLTSQEGYYRLVSQ